MTNRARSVYWGLGGACRQLSADITVRRQEAIEFHCQGLGLAEAAHPDVVWWDVHHAHFPWLIHLFQLGDPATARAYLERGERIAKALPEGSRRCTWT